MRPEKVRRKKISATTYADNAAKITYDMAEPAFLPISKNINGNKTSETNTPTKTQKHPGGRPTVITPEVIAKLEHAFSIGATDREAIAFAEVSQDAFYDYQKKHPEFAERKERLKQRPVLLAQNTIIKNLEDPKVAQWYLERRKPRDFSARVEVTGADGAALTPPQINILPVAVGVAKKNK